MLLKIVNDLKFFACYVGTTAIDGNATIRVFGQGEKFIDRFFSVTDAR
jgi:hypothetical protein